MNPRADRGGLQASRARPTEKRTPSGLQATTEEGATSQRDYALSGLTCQFPCFESEKHGNLPNSEANMCQFTALLGIPIESADPALAIFWVLGKWPKVVIF